MACASPMMSVTPRSVVTYFESACTVEAMDAASADSSFLAMADMTKRWLAARYSSPGPISS